MINQLALLGIVEPKRLLLYAKGAASLRKKYINMEVQLTNL